MSALPKSNANTDIIQAYLNNGGPVQRLPSSRMKIRTFGPKTAGVNLVRHQIVDAMRRPEILENK